MSERRVLLTESNARLKIPGMVYDLSRAWFDPGHPLFDSPGFGYLKVPYCREVDGWEPDPGDDVRYRVRYKGRRKGYAGVRAEKDEEGRWWWILSRADVHIEGGKGGG